MDNELPEDQSKVWERLKHVPSTDTIDYMELVRLLRQSIFSNTRVTQSEMVDEIERAMRSAARTLGQTNE